MARDLGLSTNAPMPHATSSAGVPVLAGLAFGVIQLALPMALPWATATGVQALLLAAIAAVYVGFAVADARPHVIAVEAAIAVGFVLLATSSLVGPTWLLVAGYVGHGLKDLWQERRQFVANTGWWPPFCAAVDWVVAAGLIVAIAARVDLRG